jgi:hypothetical protein
LVNGLLPSAGSPFCKIARVLRANWCHT